jgi:hypothetical protein
MGRVKEKADDTGKRRRWGCIAVICGVVALVVIVVAVLAYIVLHKIPETPKEAFFNPALDGFVEVEFSQHDFGLQSALHRIVSTFNQRHPNEEPTSVDQIHGVVDFLVYRRIYCFFDSDPQTQTRRFLIVMNFKRLGPVIQFFTRKSFKELQQRTGRTMTFLKSPIFQTQGGRLFYAFTRSSLLLSNNIEMLKQGILQQDKFDQRKWKPSTAFQRFLNQTPKRGVAHGFLLNTDNWLERVLDNLGAELEESEDLANLPAQLQQANVSTDQIDGFQVVVELQSYEALKATVSFECVEASTADRLALVLYNSLLPSLKKQVEKDVRLETEVKRQDKVVVVTINIRGMEKYLDQLAGEIGP